MKRLALVVLAIVLIAGIAIFAYGRWRREQIQAIGKQSEVVELLHGPVAAAIYARCHLHPPTTKEDQASANG
jgi:fucose 4-O-acetylase-like acetyltransferase